MEIALSNGLIALIDDTDFDKVRAHSWSASRTSSTRVYAAYKTVKNGKGVTVYMHRAILGAPKGMEVDHINGNGLDNRRSNLRLVTRRQNTINARLSIRNTTGFRGVSPARRPGRYVATIHVNRTKRHLGTFPNPTEAAVAYDAAAREHFGEFARLNFPERGEQAA